MARMYDVYLNNRLTEFDIVIRNLPFRDAPVIHTTMYLDTMLGFLCLQKFIVGVHDVALRAKIDDLLERVYNIYQSNAELKFSVDVNSVKPIGGSSGAILYTSNPIISEQSFNTLSNFVHLTTSSLHYDLAKSLGTGSSKMVLSTKITDTFKEVFGNYYDSLILDAQVKPSSSKFADTESTLVLSTNRFDLFYLLTIQCEAMLNLLASVDYEIWYTLGMAENEFVLATHMDDAILTKLFTIDELVNLLSDVVATLDYYVQIPNVSVELLAHVEAELRRYRKVYEVDPLSIADIDLLSVEDLDYVVLV